MKTIFLSIILLILLIFQFASCTNESDQSFIDMESDIEIREKSQKEVSPYSLLYQKEVFGFDYKRDLYSFLAKKDETTAIFLAEVIVSDLNKEYVKKFGENYMKDLKLWKNFEKDLEEEFDLEDLPSSYECITCTIFPESCDDYQVFTFFDPDFFKIRVYDDAQYTGKNYVFDDSKSIIYSEYDVCTGTTSNIELPNLVTRGQIWNNKISSFMLHAELQHESAVLTLYSESNLTGSEFVYHLPEEETEIRESDLSDNYWKLRNIPLSVDNSVSSIGLKFSR